MRGDILFNFPVLDFTAQNRIDLANGERLLLFFDGCKWIYDTDAGILAITGSNGIQIVGGTDVRLNIDNLGLLPSVTTLTDEIIVNRAGQEYRTPISNLIPSITKYTPMGIITNADTNPAFPAAPIIGDARDITTNAGTVGGLAVTPGDLLVFSSSGWIVLQGDVYTGSLGVEKIGNDFQMDIDSLPPLLAPLQPTDTFPVNRAGVDYEVAYADFVDIPVTQSYLNILAQILSAPNQTTIIENIPANAAPIAALNAESKLAGNGTYTSQSYVTADPISSLTNHNLATVLTAINTAKTPIRVATGAGGFGIDGDGVNYWTSSYNDSTVRKYDVATNLQVGAPLNIGGNPEEMILDAGFLYACRRFGSGITKIDAAGMTIVSNLVTGTRPAGIVKLGTNLFVVHHGSATVVRVDIASFTITGTSAATGGNNYGIGTDGTFIYFTSDSTNRLYKMDPVSMAVDPVSAVLGGQPYNVRCLGGFAYVTEFGGLLYKVDTSTMTTVGSLACGSGSHGLEIDGTTAYVTNYNAGSISRINLGSFTKISDLTGLTTTMLFIKKIGGYLYSPSFSTNVVTVVQLPQFVEIGYQRQGTISVNGQPYIGQSSFVGLGSSVTMQYVLSTLITGRGTEAVPAIADSVVPNATFDLNFGVTDLLPATQAESDAGLVANKYISPVTAYPANRPLQNSIDYINDIVEFLDVSTGLISKTSIGNFAKTEIVDPLVVTATNTLSNLAQTPKGPVKLIVNGLTYIEGLHFTRSGLTLSRLSAVATFNLVPIADRVFANYQY